MIPCLRVVAVCALAGGLLAMIGSGALAGETGDVAQQDAVTRHAAEIRDWRERRDARLRSEDGWLTLVGFDWLDEGANTVGSGPDNDIRLPGGPESWGSVFLDGDSLRFERAAGASVTVGGQPADSVVLVSDDEGEPTVVRSGGLSFHVLRRGSYALRVQDVNAPTRVNFRGVDNFDIQHDWRIDARYVPAEPGTTIDIGDVLGQVTPNPVHGYIEFEREGRTHRLAGLGDAGSESLWFIFADRTSGSETYGAGRFVYSDGLPENGRLVVDFNKAYNPPCVFTEYSTCPLPPAQNRLHLAVTAGEKDYRAK